MRKTLLHEPFSCIPICRVIVLVERIVSAVGPAGDSLYVPLRIFAGSVTGMGPEKKIVFGSDFATMHADEKLVHNGRFVVSDPAGDILVWYDGCSQAVEGAYDALLDGQLPGKIPCRLNVRFVSTGRDWRALNRMPYLGVGSFDGVLGTLDFAVLSVRKNETELGAGRGMTAPRP